MIDTQQIVDAILASGVGPLACETGANLVDSYVDKFWSQDSKTEIVAVECGWSIALDPDTYLIGVMDLIAKDDQGIFGRELKTTKEPSRWWSEEKWLEDIKQGHQIALYALALNRGTFYEEGQAPARFDVACPVRMNVRAAVKSNPPQFWPKDEEDGWQSFEEKDFTAIINAFRVKAENIRSARRLNIVPWQLQGKQCVAFNRDCEYSKICRTRSSPPIVSSFDGEDPAAKLVLPHIKATENTVILSASAYSDYSRCLELGRLNAQADGKRDDQALQIGSAFHAGAAQVHRTLREQYHA